MTQPIQIPGNRSLFYQAATLPPEPEGTDSAFGQVSMQPRRSTGSINVESYVLSQRNFATTQTNVLDSFFKVEKLTFYGGRFRSRSEPYFLHTRASNHVYVSNTLRDISDELNTSRQTSTTSASSRRSRTQTVDSEAMLASSYPRSSSIQQYAQPSLSQTNQEMPHTLAQDGVFLAHEFMVQMFDVPRRLINEPAYSGSL